MVMGPVGNEWSQAHALFLREIWNMRGFIASVEASLIFKVSHTLRKAVSCKFRSSLGVPRNWDYCTMDISDGLTSKFFSGYERSSNDWGLVMGSWSDTVPNSPLHIFSSYHRRSGCLLLKCFLHLQFMKSLLDLIVKLNECSKVGVLVYKIEGTYKALKQSIPNS